MTQCAGSDCANRVSGESAIPAAFGVLRNVAPSAILRQGDQCSRASSTTPSEQTKRFGLCIGPPAPLDVSPDARRLRACVRQTR